jgi:nucleoside phosphorylase
MPLDWRDTLKTLLPQFQAKAASSTGLYHMMVEVTDHERDKMSGPPWFGGFTSSPHVVNGEILYRRWDCSRSTFLPGVSPGFREPTPDETFDDSERVIRDKNGVVRAVPVPMKIRQSYFCGCPSEEVLNFESLANMAAHALMDAVDLTEHFLATELCDLFRRPYRGVRYVFGEVSNVPRQFISQGWDAGVLQYEHGVLIDVPISESTPDSSHWMLLLHRLGWKKPKGSPLTAHRACWNGNIEVTYDMLNSDWCNYPDQFAKQFANISRESFYSVLGSKDAPVDVNLASVFAIQLLTAYLATNQSTVSSDKKVVDYSREAWYSLPCPQIKSVSKQQITNEQHPQVGIVVATEIERKSLLCRLKPPQNKRSVLQVFEGNNTYFVGRLGVVNVVVVMSAMGSVGRDASTLVTAELIELWNLNAVVMVGIAFGKDAEKQMIGGVLVSERIQSYESQRLGTTESHNRGEEHKSSTILLNRFRNVIGWKFKNPDDEKCSHQIGPVLSGEKLVDNPAKKAELFSRYPTAIGGEMEGAGFAAAAERKNCEWIVVKAICDWGDGTKQKHHQAFAAAAAVDLLTHVLNQVGALDALSEQV